jgi:hypothetical protein
MSPNRHAKHPPCDHEPVPRPVNIALVVTIAPQTRLARRETASSALTALALLSVVFPITKRPATLAAAEQTQLTLVG